MKTRQGPPNKSLKLTPKVQFWFEWRPIAGVRFALVNRRRSLTLCYTVLNLLARVVRVT